MFLVLLKKMFHEKKKCRKTKLVPREIIESDEEIFAMQSVVENTLARINRPFKRALTSVSVATPSILLTTNPIEKMDACENNGMPMNFDIKIQVEKVDDNEIERYQESLSRSEILKESTKIYLNTHNICDKMLHAQVLNICTPDVKAFVKSPHDKLLDRALQRWCDWASLTEEPKDPPLFYKCYICDMAWWHLSHFRDHTQTHNPSTLRVVLEMNDYAECNIVAYVNKSINRHIGNIEGKCWKCGETAIEHTKPKNCSGCKKRLYTCSKLRQHQWYCEGFKKMHLELFTKAEKILKCHLCRFYFFKTEDSIQHMITRHSVRSDVPIPGCVVCVRCNGLMASEDEHACETDEYVETCCECKKRVTRSSAALHQVEGNFTCSICNKRIVKNCSVHLHALTHTVNYGAAYKCLTCKGFIIFDEELITRHQLAYHSGRDFDYDLIMVPKTIVDRIKLIPNKISPKCEPKDSDDDIHEIEDDDDVIIVDNVPDVVYVPGDDEPSDILKEDLPCVIANIKSEPLESEIQPSNTDASSDKSEFETYVIKVPKNTKGTVQCFLDRSGIDDSKKVLTIDQFQNEVNSELNLAVQSILGARHNTANDFKNNDENNTPITRAVQSTSDTYVDANIKDLTRPLINIKKSMDLTYKEMENRKRTGIQHTEIDIEGELPLAYVKTKSSMPKRNIEKYNNRRLRQETESNVTLLKNKNPKSHIRMEVLKSLHVDEKREDTRRPDQVIKLETKKPDIPSKEVTLNIQKQNTIKSIKQYKVKLKKTLLTGITQNSEPTIKMEVLKSVQVAENRSLLRMESLQTDELNTQTQEINTDLHTERTNALAKLRTVEIEVPVRIKEEADPEMDLKLSDIKKIYHINVDVGENEVIVKSEFNEFDVSEQTEDWHVDNSDYNSQNSSDDEFENDLITLTPFTSSAPDDGVQVKKRKCGKIYSCTRCNFQGVHKVFKQHKQRECFKVSFYNYYCSICMKRFITIYTYVLHFVKHNVPNFTCPKCGHKSDTANGLATHVKVHIKSEIVSYRSLNSDDISKSPLDKVGRDRTTYKCNDCGSAVTPRDFFKHWDTHLNLDNIRDTQLKSKVEEWHRPHGFQTLIADDKLELNEALELFTNPEKLMAKCNFRVCILCSRHFSRQNDCKRHLIEHFLRNAYAHKTRLGGLACQICGNVYDKIDMFRSHMRLHACLPVYKCEMCNRTFSDSSNFSKHKKVHNFQILICDICKKKFNNKSYLARHIQAHETTPVHTCEICKKTFFTTSSYKRHDRVHHNVTLRSKCYECNLVFLTTKEKFDHMWIVHNQRQVQADCSLCDAKYRKKADLKRHYVKVHAFYDFDTPDNKDFVVVKTEPVDSD